MPYVQSSDSNARSLDLTSFERASTVSGTLGPITNDSRRRRSILAPLLDTRAQLIGSATCPYDRTRPKLDIWRKNRARGPLASPPRVLESADGPLLTSPVGDPSGDT